jgi:hypothetical protein
MKEWRRAMRVAGLLCIAVLVPVVSAAQELRKPLPPIAPKDVSECEALRKAWEPVLQQLDQVHDQCFRKHLFRGDWLTVPGPCGGNLQTTDKVCLPAALQEARAVCERNAQVEACRGAVDDYRARQRDEERERAEQEKAATAAEEEQQQRREQIQREAEQMQNAWAEQQRKRVEDTRRLVEEQQRAAAEAERQRREDSRRAVNDAIRELSSARQRAEAYKAKAEATPWGGRVELTAGEQHQLNDLRRRAESDGLRPRYVSAQPAPRVPSDAAQLTQAVAGLLGSHAEDLIKWGLNRVEVGERMVQGWELADGYAAKFEAVMGTWQHGRSAWAGTATYEENVDAVVAGSSALADYAFMNPAIAIQVGRAVSSTADMHKAALYQIQMMVTSTDLSADDIARLSSFRAIVAAQYGIFLDGNIWADVDDLYEPVELPESFGR